LTLCDSISQEQNSFVYRDINMYHLWKDVVAGFQQNEAGQEIQA